MTGDLSIRTEGRAGRITLTRPKALNALSHEMSLAIEDALEAWAEDDAVALVILDAEGEKAFCAGGDIARIHAQGTAGALEGPRSFWRDEYRMNARLATYPKPVAAFMQGFVMGGGVGIGCHASHRVVGDTTRIAMPECGIGLMPDVGGTLLLARAPGRAGEYLGLTGARMKATDAIHAGFADFYIPEALWPDLIAMLVADGDAAGITSAAVAPPEGTLPALAPEIDRLFAASDLPALIAALTADGHDFATDTLATLRHHSPLSMACTLDAVRRMRGQDDIRAALALEYRFTWRSMDQGDLLEGIRAQIIDKDRTPHWKHRLEMVDAAAVAAMLAPLGAAELTFEREDTP